MADVFLIVSVTVAFLILFVVAVYLLVYYQHPDDHNEAYFPKFVVIIGIMLAGATALLLPLDVANNEGYPGRSFRSFSLVFFSNPDFLALPVDSSLNTNTFSFFDNCMTRTVPYFAVAYQVVMDIRQIYAAG